jgi:hypothetical protein
MEEITLTAATWFWLLIPMPLTIVLSILTYILEKDREE